MDPVLERLIRYQELSLERSRLEKVLQGFPEEIQRIDRALQAETGAIETARAALEEARKRRRQQEGALQDLEVKLRKYNDQLMQVRTNDEYKAMQSEIGGVKETIGGIEETVLLLMEEMDDLQTKITEAEAVHAGKKKEADAKRGDVTRRQEVVQKDVARVEEEIATARSGIDAKALDMFQRIAGYRNGVAVARAVDERCQECKVRLRPQMFAEIRRNERIVQCTSCQRILYFLAAAAPQPPEAAPAANPEDAHVSPTRVPEA